MKRSYFTCLMYHELVESPLNKFSVTPQAFENQIQELFKQGTKSYQLGISIDTKGSYCMITFDDGHISNLQAAELLADAGMTGYFYLIKDYSLNKENYLSEKDIKEIARLGHKLGVHGKDHMHWPKKNDKQLIDELKETKDWIEQLTGAEVNTCSAPGGVINQRTIEIINREIPSLKYIRTSRYGINYVGDTVLHSIGVRGDYALEKVIGIAKNDWWTMQKIMAYYHAKELLKPIYHFFK